MTKNSIGELVRGIRPRYRQAKRAEKSCILDEFVATTGYHRKYAIRLLNHGLKQQGRERRGRPKTYPGEVTSALMKIWQICDHICSKRLYPFLPEIVEVLEREGELVLPEEAQHLLLQMSSATIDRLLQRVRPQRRGGWSTTKPGTLLKQAIPVRTFADWDDARPGFVEMDLIAYCGDSTHGEYLNTLNVVDASTGWSEVGLNAWPWPIAASARCRWPLNGCGSGSLSPCWGLTPTTIPLSSTTTSFATANRRRSPSLARAPTRRTTKPTWSKRTGLSCGVGSAMSGMSLAKSWRSCEPSTRIGGSMSTSFNQFSNWSGSAEWAVSKVRQQYDTARTPYRRVLASPDVSEQDKERLRQTYATLNPVVLRQHIDENLEKLWKLSR